MKKTALSLAVAATVAASAQANMYIDGNNEGEVLIYPFYTADGGNETYITVVNTTAHYKAAKVRILEAEDSKEVRDFNLYLSPYDHFSFAISKGADGYGQLETADVSCTVPQIDGPVPFTLQLAEDAKDTNLDPSRTLQGYVEIIEMGQFNKTAADAKTPVGSLWLHKNGAKPAGCATLVKYWTAGGAWAQDAAAAPYIGTTGMIATWDGGGLYGYGMIVNPEKGTAMGYDATAIDNAIEGNGAVNHYEPGSVKPNFLSPGFDTESTVFANGAAANFSYGGTNARLDAVSSTMMTTGITNDYILDDAFDGSTDWVITFPTKRQYVATGVSAVTKKANPADLPFYIAWNGNESCDPISYKFWDREEQDYTPDPDEPMFSPAPEYEYDDYEICYEANVVTFTQDLDAADSALFGDDPSVSEARIQLKLKPYTFEHGWAEISFLQSDLIDPAGYGRNFHRLPAATGDTLLGLPAVGFAVVEFENGTLEGGSIMANYQAAIEHKTEVATS